MGRRTRLSKITTNRSVHLYFLFGLSAFFLGCLSVIMMTQVFSQTADTNQIYACVNKVNGEMRMVTSDTVCKNNEKSVKWSIQGPPGPQGPAGDTGGLNQYFGLPFFCTNCYLVEVGDRFTEKDFSYAQIVKSFFNGSDMHGVIFKGAFLRSNNFDDTNLSGADFSEMKVYPEFGNSKDNYFKRSNLAGADFTNSYVQDSDFREANLTNVNFTNAIIKNSNFQNATNMSTANFSGATWDNATCPDGTKSINNGNTCIGHF